MVVFVRSKKSDWEKVRENDCRDSFRADSKTKFFPRTCFRVRNKHDKRKHGLFKEENLVVRRCYVYVARLIVAMATNQTK